MFSGFVLLTALFLMFWALPQERVDEYCQQLHESLGRMHEEARDMEEQNRRKRARAEVNKGPGMRFNVGDYVMVSAVKNQANRQRHSKTMSRSVPGSVRSDPRC